MIKRGIAIAFIFLLLGVAIRADAENIRVRVKLDTMCAENYLDFQRYAECYRDWKAVQELLDEGVIKPIKKGTEVVAVDQTDEFVKCRKEGSSKTFWVFWGALNMVDDK